MKTPGTKLSMWLLVGSVIFVIATMIITRYRNSEARKAAAWVDHTYEVIESASELVSSLATAQTFVDDIVTTGNRKEPFVQFALTRQKMDTLKSELLKLVSDSESQTLLLNDGIIRTIDRQYGIWNLHLNGAQPDANIPEDMGANRTATLDTIFILTNRFTENERALLKDRQATLGITYMINDVTRWVLLSSIGVTCLLALFTIERQKKENGKLFLALTKSNADLESKIGERTSQLERSNRELQESINQINKLNASIETRNKDLQETLSEVQLLYDHAPCGYHTVDKNGLIVRMNKTELDWLGYEEHEVVGVMTVDAFLTPEGLKNRAEMVSKLKTFGKVDGIEADFLRKDGSVMPVYLNTIAYFDSGGTFLMNRSTVFDISSRKALEERLRLANDHLVQLNEEKDRFLATATHDLKNPINNLYAIIDILRNKSNIPDDLQEYFKLMELVLKRMKDLVERLLNLNEIEQATSGTRHERIDMDAFLSSLANRFELVAQKKQIQVVIENHHQGQHLISDRMLLDQILDNLVSNAIKFSPFYKLIWIRYHSFNDQCIFEVEDQGPGISPEEQQRLFKTFQRLSATPTGGETSTGLGLSIVKAITKQLGGQISVTSEFGKGTIFTLKLKQNVL